MTERRTAYETTEPREVRAVLCIPTVVRNTASCWRSWVEVVGRDGHPIQHGYLLDDEDTPAIAIPAAMAALTPRHFRGGEIVPWERVPQGIQEHVLHVIDGVEA